MTRPRDIGTKAETAVVRYLVANGYPHAERRSLRGALDAGDITGTPAVCWEVKGGEAAKAASDLTILTWMAELTTEVVNAKAAVGVLVVQRRGVGPSNAGRWWAYMHAFQLGALVTEVVPPPGRAVFPVRMLLADAVTLLRAAGYGQPTEPRPAVAPYLPTAATPEGTTDIALPGLEAVR
ncbi:hypothetical protein [Micromonospora sp. NPDC005299]|uniref:hypothetical protein n=1 Tax=Micromonospora sp. NPDC005299 TaxID=3364231 RepID=UPI0036B87CD8